MKENSKYNILYTKSKTQKRLAPALSNLSTSSDEFDRYKMLLQVWFDQIPIPCKTIFLVKGIKILLEKNPLNVQLESNFLNSIEGIYATSIKLGTPNFITIEFNDGIFLIAPINQKYRLFLLLSKLQNLESIYLQLAGYINQIPIL